MTLRKQRGFKFEYHIVEMLRNRGFNAKKSGGNTVGFPDIIATRHYTLLGIEAKSVAGFHAYIPLDQIQRCFQLLEMFNLYQNRYAIAAFKFMSKVTGNDFRRPIKYYYFLMEERFFEHIEQFKYLRCVYNGELAFITELDESLRKKRKNNVLPVKLPYVTFNN